MFIANVPDDEAKNQRENERPLTKGNRVSKRSSLPASPKKTQPVNYIPLCCIRFLSHATFNHTLSSIFVSLTAGLQHPPFIYLFIFFRYNQNPIRLPAVKQNWSNYWLIKLWGCWKIQGQDAVSFYSAQTLEHSLQSLPVSFFTLWATHISIKTNQETYKRTTDADPI